MFNKYCHKISKLIWDHMTALCCVHTSNSSCCVKTKSHILVYDFTKAISILIYLCLCCVLEPQSRIYLRTRLTEWILSTIACLFLITNIINLQLLFLTSHKQYTCTNVLECLLQKMHVDP